MAKRKDPEPGDNRQYLRRGTGEPADPPQWPPERFDHGSHEDEPKAENPATMPASDVLSQQLGGTGETRGRIAPQSRAVQSTEKEEPTS